jgi:beta-aspartyl-peptidase (threonine type)
VIIVASTNARPALESGWEMLSGGGSALDAVEAVTRLVEDDPSDHTVGLGGYPNVLGQVELDASIMDGATRRAGAVGGMRGYRQAISVARAVMERTPHVLVVGEGASRLAAEIGLQPSELLTADAEKVWRDGLGGHTDDPLAEGMLAAMVELVSDPELAGGTVNVLALDGAGHLASAVSTSGWAWKYPGRLGDSPVIGAGNYCDDRFGAAACTGFGELAIRVGAARMVVSLMARGASPEEACADVLVDARSLDPDARLNVVALAPSGEHAGTSIRAETSYAVHDGGGAVERPRRHVS